jgi:hypothetical protein
MRIAVVLWSCVLAFGGLIGTAEAADLSMRVGDYHNAYHRTPVCAPKRYRVVRFSEFDYYSYRPLAGKCYPQEAPIPDCRGNWIWGIKNICY